MAGIGSFSLAGSNPSYADRMRQALEQSSSALKPFVEGLPEDQRFIGPLMGFNLANQMLSSDPEAMMQTLERMEPFFQRRAEKQQQLAMQSNLFGALIKDVPASISNAFAQRQRYAPEKIEIAARAMQNQPRGGSVPNYYGFVG